MQRRHLLMVTIVVMLLVSGCVPYWLQPGVNRDVIFHTSTIDDLSAGDYDGYMTIGALKLYGDFGLGTFDALDGEMVVLDQVVYQITDDGTARVSDDATITPFAAVTYFDTDQTVEVAESMQCSDFYTYMDSLLRTIEAPYAIKVSGTFDYLQVRAPRKQSQPYPTLTDALADQAIFESNDVMGTMVGFRMPESAAGANATGYHFHYISDDRTAGGHVLDCRPQSVTIEIDESAGWYVDITENAQ